MHTSPPFSPDVKVPSATSNYWFVACAAVLILLLFASSAQAQSSRTNFQLELSMAPTVNWLNDVQVRLHQLQNNPTETDPDSLLQLFNNDEFPARIGFRAGLALTMSRGALGLRGGVNVLNTGGVFDGSDYLNQQKLLENFVIAHADLQWRRAMGPAQFYIFGGPEFRYHLDLRDESEITLSSFQRNMEPLSTTAALGAGLSLRFMGMRLTPELRYAHDLSGVSGRTFEADGYDFELSDKYRLNALSFGLLFGL